MTIINKGPDGSISYLINSEDNDPKEKLRKIILEKGF